MKALHDHEHLATLQRYYAQHRVLPSYARLMEILGYASKSAVKKVLERLETAGMLERTPDGDWAPTERFFERVVANEPVPAGMPVTTLDDGVEQMTIDRFLIQDPGETVLIRVKGDSMINAGIHDGDVVIVDRSIKPMSGKVIIATLNGEMLIRRFDKTFNKIKLIPETSKLASIDIDPYAEFSVWGVVTYVIHAL